MDILSYVLGYKKGVKSGGGSGGGGGSLPAGVYTETLRVKPPTVYGQTWFYFEGELYAASLPYTGGGNDVTIYKYVDGAWSEVVAKRNYGSAPSLYGPSDWVFIEYNGVLHIYCQNSAKGHAKFTGTSVVAYNNLPGNAYGVNQMVVHNNTLKFYCYTDGWLYAWDEATDTWTQEAQIGSASNSRYLYVIGGELYVVQYNSVCKVYKYEGGALTEIYTLVSTWPTMLGQDDRYIYFTYAKNTSFSVLKKIDVTTCAESEVGIIRGAFIGWIADGQIRCTIGTEGTANSYSYLVSHIVESTE